jgi:transglutaminase/protease-like cytokinesis protein 3
MPASAETSIESVAQYIASQEKDPMLRIKALHDYVADRIAYDAPNYFAGNYPPQDAETVFQRRVAVCAGYAKLLEALGQAIGEEIVYVVGDSRSSTSDLEGQRHAWNAAKINGQWYLIDPTWNSGYIDRASGFTKSYKADYLFPPPEVMGISHFPEDQAWQLRSQPISRGEFLRQPMMRARFFADGMDLVSPTRSQTDTNGSAVINLKNPDQRWLLTSYAPKGSNQDERCTEEATQGPQITCPLPRSGSYEVKLFSSDEQYGTYAYVGQLEFNRR